MPEQAVKPRTVLTACCGNSFVWSEVIMGTGGGSPPVENFLLLEDDSFILLEDGTNIILE